MTENLTGMVEEITGRKVLTYQSQVLFDPDRVIEIFIFDERAPDAVKYGPGLPITVNLDVAQDGAVVGEVTDQGTRPGSVQRREPNRERGGGFDCACWTASPTPGACTRAAPASGSS